MANKTVKLFNSVAAGASPFSDSIPVPVGKVVLVTEVGASDINTGDNKSSLFQVLWGTTSSFIDVMVFGLTGSTYEIKLDEEFIGNGAKFFRVIRTNNSSAAKRLPFWMKIVERPVRKRP